MCVNFSDTVKICWFFFTCLNKIGETLFHWLAVVTHLYGSIYHDHNYIYGILQVLINFAPFLWALTAYLVQKRRNENSLLTKEEFLWQIPIAFEVRNFKLWKMLKDTIRENQKSRSSESRDLVMMMESQIQTARMYQTFGTSIPSLILKFVFVIRSLAFYNINFKWSDLPELLKGIAFDDLTGLKITRLGCAFSLLALCFISLIMVTETFIYMPIYQKTEMTKMKTLNQTKKAHLFILPLIAVIFLPRMINLGLFFGSWRHLGCLFTFIGAFTIYTIGFAILIWKKYKKEWKENSYPLVLSYFTSFFCPCIIMHAESKLVFFASLVSTIPHLILTSALLILANYYPKKLSPRLASSDFNFLLPCFLIAPVFAWLLSAYSREKTQKILLNAINYKVVMFFLFTIVLSALDDVTDILTAMNYFR